MSEHSAIILGGRSGLLGQALDAVLCEAGWSTHPIGRDDFDVFDTEALMNALEREEPTHLFNTVAYTAVDQAEDDPNEAFRLNRNLPALLARVCKSLGVSLVHYSTDFVFSGKTETPYTEEDQPGPESVYGKSKLAGEQVIAEVAPPRSTIIRTSWLFGPHKTNFVYKMIELGRDRDKLQVVHDQIGSPTYTMDLARNSLSLIEAGGEGLYHLSGKGQASWCELAAEALWIAGIDCQVQAIPTSDFPTKAPRPAFSVLDCDKFNNLTGISPRPWATALRDYVYKDLGLPHV